MSQVPGTMDGMLSAARPPSESSPIADIATDKPEALSSDAHPAYAYLLGLYLGDGDITSHARGVVRLRVTLDSRYPGIVSCASRAMSEVLPHNRVGIHARTDSNAKMVTCYSKSWPKLLPQHGPGVKHLRTIALHPWQRRITHSFPREFVRGLIHSDGCRFVARQRVDGRIYEYPRYCFSNISEDIHQLFCEHLDLLGVRYTRTSPVIVQIAQRISVHVLDSFIGPKL
jgi:hypothetical protein